MSKEQKENSGLILWLSQQSLPIRFVSFIVFIILILGAIVGIMLGLYFLNVSNYPRLEPFALAENVSVREFATFDDKETYPSALASASDGNLYTGSFVHGAIWRVDSNGNAYEISQSRENIGSVIGIDSAEDGSICVLDHIDPFEAGGAKIWHIYGDTIDLRWISSLDDTVPISKPNDIAVDAHNRLFVLDIVEGRILLIDIEGTSIWWQAPDETYQIAGLAYDSSTDSIFVSDAARHAVYSIPAQASDTEAERQTVFMLMESLQDEPSFNGIDVSADGTLYVAAFGINEIWQISPNSNTYTVLANNYRGSSDVAYDASQNRLYVNNWDQSWLLPIQLLMIQVNVPPRLPFSVDVIEFDS